MKLLFVNACPRESNSRTLRIAQAFLKELQKICSDITMIQHDLPTMNLQPIDAQRLALREPMCDSREWEHPFLRPAVEFHSADVLLIAAPYWDLSFPAMLKVWVENIYVRNLNFYYKEERCIGLAKARQAVYITTAGSPIGENDWGSGYMQAVLKSLGIEKYTSIRAEGIDLWGCDVEKELERAEGEARDAARLLSQQLNE